MQEAADLAALRGAAAAVRDRFVTGSDEELIADTALLEEIGRTIDGLRAKAAWQLEWRSRQLLGADRLSFKEGARDGVDLVQVVTGVSHSEAKRRIGIGTALAPVTALGVETGPGPFGNLAQAVLDGEVGIEAARQIVNLHKHTHKRAFPADLVGTIGNLVDDARVLDEERLREAIAHAAEGLDPDGPEEREKRQHRQRTFKFGKTLADGTTSARMVLTPEGLARMREFLQAKRRGIQMVRTEPGSDATGESLGPDWREAGNGTEPSDRDQGQQDYDTFMDGIALAATTEASGAVATSTTHQVVVTVSAADLEARKGRAWTPGVLAGLPMPVVERLVCNGETRLQVTGTNGETLYLSRASRLFSPAQKIALVTSSGGTCQFPGCSVPAPYLEAHHVAWWNRDDGPTDIDNGILLCSYHHHLIHAINSPVEIRRWHGDFYVTPRSWTGDPVREQRQQHAPHLERRHPQRRRRRAAPRTTRLPAGAEPE
jgi:hypothetical protein